MSEMTLALPMVGDRVDLRPLTLRPVAPRWWRTAGVVVCLAALSIGVVTDVQAYRGYSLAVNDQPVVQRLEAESASLTQAAQAMRAKAAAGQAAEAAITALGPPGYGMVSRVLGALPRGAAIQTVAITGETVTISGTAAALSEVSQYAFALSSVPGLSSPMVNSVTQAAVAASAGAGGGGGSDYTYSMTVNVTGGAANGG